MSGGGLGESLRKNRNVFSLNGCMCERQRQSKREMSMGGGRRSVRNPKIPSSAKNRVICNEMRLCTCLYSCTWKVTCRYKCVDSKLLLEIRFFPSRNSVNKTFL
jgi:hypothetical protein